MLCLNTFVIMNAKRITLVLLILPLWVSAQFNISVEASKKENVEFGKWDVVTRKALNLSMSTTDRNGTYRFSSEEEPGIYQLIIGEYKPIYLAIEKNESPKIICNEEGCVVQNSPGTALFNKYHEFRKESLNRLVISIRNDIRTARISKDQQKIAELTVKENRQYLVHKTELTSFVKNQMGNSIAIWATSTRWNPETDLKDIKAIFEQFKTKHPHNSLTKKFAEKIERFEQIQPGANAPEIKLPNLEGATKKLSSYKGKVVLLEFWASWCGPCRRENPHLKKLYTSYKEKGFEIFAVSIDKREKSWKKATEKDLVDWVNVSDLKGYQGDAPFQYSISSIPANFLIDKQGKIIAMNLFGKELETAIKNALTHR